jgi:hypothetical protein
VYLLIICNIKFYSVKCTGTLQKNEKDISYYYNSSRKQYEKMYLFQERRKTYTPLCYFIARLYKAKHVHVNISLQKCA